MIDVGHFALVAAWFLSLYGFVGGSLGAYRENISLQQSASRSVHLVAFFSVLSLFCLGIAFVSHDYRYAYVWQHSDNAMHPVYLISAIWGGMDGSMLLWAVIGSIFASLVVKRKADVSRKLLSWVVPVLSGATNFFLLVVTFLTNPFRLIPTENLPLNGNGLNPLLQNPSMMIHPPMLYLGFTGFVVPFAFCLAALLSGELSSSWTRITRRWTLVAWGFLTAGIILGGNWAYIELGWGGFWAWDPVENASFLPWLTGTAYLHSVMVQQHRGMLKVWNVSLCVLTYLLTVFGTFLTRSGIVQSVHAFAETDVGWVFLVYIGVILFASIVLIASRWKVLRPENRIESFFSRETVFLFNNLLFLGICFATFWGVLFPVISEAVTGEKSVVGPPFFNQVNVPLFLALLFLMGVGPLMAWRRASLQALWKTFWKPLLSGSAVTLLFLWIDSSRVSAAIGFGLSVFVLTTILIEFHRAVAVRRTLASESALTSVVKLVTQKRQRYGGLLVHLGVVVMAVAITASMAYKIERDFTLAVGKQIEIGNYALELKSLHEERNANYTSLSAQIKLLDRKDKKFLGMLEPERRFYFQKEEATTEVDIRTTLREDVYIALASLDIPPGTKGPVNLETASAIFKVFINPLQVWLWLGSVVVLLGTVVVIGPRVHAAYSQEGEGMGAETISKEK